MSENIILYYINHVRKYIFQNMLGFINIDVNNKILHMNVITNMIIISSLIIVLL